LNADGENEPFTAGTVISGWSFGGKKKFLFCVFTFPGLIEEAGMTIGENDHERLIVMTRTHNSPLCMPERTCALTWQTQSSGREMTTVTGSASPYGEVLQVHLWT